VQKITVFCAGIQAGAQHAEAAKQLLAVLTAPAAAAVYKKHGLEPG
jgi:hypothetical protein